MACMVSMRLRVESNGTSSTRGYAWLICGAYAPALAAATRMEPSVGSPMMRVVVLLDSISSSSASLFKTPTHKAVERPGKSFIWTFFSFSRKSPRVLYPVPVMLKKCLSTHMRVTVISFWVRVPVLSEQMTVAEPSVSTEERRRIRACLRTISRIPNARLMVTTAGKPSGTAAIARLTAIMNISTMASISKLERNKPTRNTRAHIARAAQPNNFPRLSRRFCRGVSSSSTICSMPAINPSWVCMPVETTTPLPRP